MGGFFGVASKGDCITDLFYGTDYHSHLGTKRGGMAIIGSDGFVAHHPQHRKQPSSAPNSTTISPAWRAQRHRRHQRHRRSAAAHPLASRRLRDRHRRASCSNTEALAAEAFRNRRMHFSEMSERRHQSHRARRHADQPGGPFEDGHRRAQAAIEGSCSILAADRKRHLRRPRPARPHAGHHRPQRRRHGRDLGNLRLSESRL